MTHTEAGFLSLNGAQIYYESAGAGDPLLLVHAGIADSRMWDDQFEEFAQRYRVIRYDMRGYGQSAPVDAPFAHHRDLHALMDALGIERAHLVGCSMGGTACIDFVLEHPQRVRSLVAVACDPSGFQFENEAPPQWDALVAAWDKGNFTRVAELEVQMWVDGPTRTPDQVPARLRDRVREMNEIALRNEALELGEEEPLEPPAAERLGEITVPVLLVSGELDRSRMLSAATFMRARLPHAQSLVVPGSAHLPSMEKPALLNDTVLKFLAGVEQ